MEQDKDLLFSLQFGVHDLHAIGASPYTITHLYGNLSSA